MPASSDRAGRRDVTPAAREAYRSLVRFCSRNAPNLEGVRGHRDCGSTTCPGAELYAFVQVLDSELAEGRIGA